MRLGNWRTLKFGSAIAFIVVVISVSLMLHAQTPNPSQNLSSTSEEHKLNRQTWKKAEDALDYTDHRKKPKEKKQSEAKEFKLTPAGQLIVIILFSVAFAAIVILILR